MDAEHLKFLTTVLTHVSDFQVDWTEVMKETGISRKDNCATKFRGIMKKYGLDYQKNKFELIDGHKPDAATTAGPSPAVSPTKSTPKKRKSVSEATADDTKTTAKGSPKKKAKGQVKAETVHEEDDGEGEK